MRACIQRVSQAAVSVSGEIVGQIESGLLVFLGVAPHDTEADLDYLLEKTVGLRIFPDEQGKMNRSVIDHQGALLVVSQFTLYGDCRRGKRPSFIAAAEPELANHFYEQFIECAQGLGVSVASGKFAADMQVELVNDGPVTILPRLPETVLSRGRSED